MAAMRENTCMIGGDFATGQSFQERPPAAPLSELVSTVWVQEVSSDAAPYPHRSIPDGRIELVCEIGSLPVINGPRTRPTVEMLSPRTTIVGLRFHAGAASSVLRESASELVDLTVVSDALWGASAVATGERIADARSPQEALAFLQQLVIAHLPAASRPDPIVAATVRRLLSGRTADIGRLAASLSISERQLRRRCEAWVGLGPKALHRMLRFQVLQALAQRNTALGRKPAGDGLARLAAEAGYADQAHLNRECLRLSGETPRSLLRQMEHHCAHGHDHAASYQPLLRGRIRQLASAAS
jgi:AraC-like DNA-binding protein